MIDITMSGMCDGCTRADLELECLTMESYMGKTEKVWSIRCIHREACDAMEYRMTERFTKHEGNL